LKDSTLQGSLKEGVAGKPVVLNLNYAYDGKAFKNRMSFSLTDMAFNAQQFEVLALGLATQEVLKIGNKLKIIPHELMDQVTALYLKRRSKADTLLQVAIKANGEIGSNPEDAKVTLTSLINKNNLERRRDRETLRNVDLSKQEQLRGIADKARMRQLSGLLTDGANWKKMSGKAYDISASANGSVWVAGIDRFPYKWNGKSWTKVANAKISHIALAPDGKVWGRSMDGKAIVWDGKSWNAKSKANFVSDIGVGADGTVWVAGRDMSPYKLTKKGWQRFPGGIERLSVGPNGRPWGISKDRKIWEWTGKKWVWRRGLATDIAVGSNGTVIVVGLGDRAPWFWDGKTWVKLSGKHLSAISVDRNGDIWGTTTNNDLWAYGEAKNAPSAFITSSKTEVLAQKAALAKAQAAQKEKIRIMKKRAAILRKHTM